MLNVSKPCGDISSCLGIYSSTTNHACTCGTHYVALKHVLSPATIRAEIDPFLLRLKSKLSPALE